MLMIAHATTFWTNGGFWMLLKVIPLMNTLKYMYEISKVCEIVWRVPPQVSVQMAHKMNFSRSYELKKPQNCAQS